MSSRPLAATRPALSQLVQPGHAIQELARLSAAPPSVPVPRAMLHGDLVQVNGRLMDKAEAVRLWSELGQVLGLADRDRRPQAWAWLADWLDDAFAGSLALDVWEGRRKLQGHAVRLADRRAMVRVGPFEVAHLRLRAPSSRTWAGALAHYWPGALGTCRRSPDPCMAHTARVIRVARHRLEAAPLVTP